MSSGISSPSTDQTVVIDEKERRTMIGSLFAKANQLIRRSIRHRMQSEVLGVIAEGNGERGNNGIGKIVQELQTVIKSTVMSEFRGFLSVEAILGRVEMSDGALRNMAGVSTIDLQAMSDEIFQIKELEKEVPISEAEMLAIDEVWNASSWSEVVAELIGEEVMACELEAPRSLSKEQLKDTLLVKAPGAMQVIYEEDEEVKEVKDGAIQDREKMEEALFNQAYDQMRLAQELAKRRVAQEQADRELVRRLEAQDQMMVEEQERKRRRKESMSKFKAAPRLVLSRSIPDADAAEIESLVSGSGSGVISYPVLFGADGFMQPQGTPSSTVVTTPRSGSSVAESSSVVESITSGEDVAKRQVINTKVSEVEVTTMDIVEIQQDKIVEVKNKSSSVPPMKPAGSASFAGTVNKSNSVPPVKSAGSASFAETVRKGGDKQSNNEKDKKVRDSGATDKGSSGEKSSAGKDKVTPRTSNVKGDERVTDNRYSRGTNHSSRPAVDAEGYQVVQSNRGSYSSYPAYDQSYENSRTRYEASEQDRDRYLEYIPGGREQSNKRSDYLMEERPKSRELDRNPSSTGRSKDDTYGNRGPNKQQKVDTKSVPVEVKGSAGSGNPKRNVDDKEGNRGQDFSVNKTSNSQYNSTIKGFASLTGITMTTIKAAPPKLMGQPGVIKGGQSGGQGKGWEHLETVGSSSSMLSSSTVSINETVVSKETQQDKITAATKTASKPINEVIHTIVESSEEQSLMNVEEAEQDNDPNEMRDEVQGEYGEQWEDDSVIYQSTGQSGEFDFEEQLGIQIPIGKLLLAPWATTEILDKDRITDILQEHLANTICYHVILHSSTGCPGGDLLMLHVLKYIQRAGRQKSGSNLSSFEAGHTYAECKSGQLQHMLGKAVWKNDIMEEDITGKLELQFNKAWKPTTKDVSMEELGGKGVSMLTYCQDLASSQLHKHMQCMKHIGQEGIMRALFLAIKMYLGELLYDWAMVIEATTGNLFTKRQKILYKILKGGFRQVDNDIVYWKRRQMMTVRYLYTRREVYYSTRLPVIQNQEGRTYLKTESTKIQCSMIY